MKASEQVKDLRLILLRNAHAVIAHTEHPRVVLSVRAHVGGARSVGMPILDRVP